MGLDLPRITTSVLFGFLIFTLMSVGYVKIGTDMGTHIIEETFDFNETFTAGQLIEAKIHNGTDNSNTFYPAISTLFDVWDICKAAMGDIGRAMTRFITYLGGDSIYMTLIYTIIVTSIAIMAAWIVLSWLFKLGGTKI